MTSAVTIDQALLDPKLLGGALGDVSTWSTWLALLRSAFGLRLNKKERALFASVAGTRKPPTKRLNELWVAAGRGSGKSRMSAAVAVYLAAFQEHDLDPGEQGFVLCLAGSRDQATLVFGYAQAFIRRSPILRKMIKSITASEIRMHNNVTIAVHTNSFRLIRGKAILAVVADEIGHWRDELSANPDLEVYRAVRPSLARCNGMWIAISTPYRRAGLLYNKHRDFFDTDNDDVLIAQGPTSVFNPTISSATIDRELAADPEGARSEWLAEFRSDIAALFDEAVIADAIDHARPLELPPRGKHKYHAFTDASAGRHDAFTCTVGHLEGDQQQFVADVVRGLEAPFDPRSVAEEFAALAHTYHCPKIVGDSFAGEWVAAAFRDAGIRYETSPLPKSSLYLESLASFNQGLVSIPNFEPLLRELRGLERRTHRSGKDSVDHGSHGSDDFANSLVGCLYMAIHEARKPKLWVGAVDAKNARVHYLPKNNPHMRDGPTRVRFVTVNEKGDELAVKHLTLEGR